MSTVQLHATAADIRAAGGLEAFTRKLAGLGAGRILAVREGSQRGGGKKSRGRASLSKCQPTCPLEDEEQAVVIAWAKAHEARCPALALLFHVPNGGHRHKATAGRLIAQGVKSGVPDLCLPVPCGGHHGLYVEMKRRTSGAVSEQQQWWLEQLRAGGYRAVVCRGAEAAIAEIKAYLGVREHGAAE